jgi:hypothetical protein
MVIGDSSDRLAVGRDGHAGDNGRPLVDIVRAVKDVCWTQQSWLGNRRDVRSKPVHRQEAACGEQAKRSSDDSIYHRRLVMIAEIGGSLSLYLDNRRRGIFGRIDARFRLFGKYRPVW